jgi:outer membrane protein assembly factor BamB
VRAIDGATGRERWAFDAELDLAGDYGDFTNRGVSTWLDPSARTGAPCRRRIFVTPVDARLIALDARTGTPCAGFGERGQIHLDRGLANAPAYNSEYSITSPPAIVNGLAVVGSSVSDGSRAAAPNGVVRAFDARTGRAEMELGSGRARSLAGRATTRGAERRRIRPAPPTPGRSSARIRRGISSSFRWAAPVRISTAANVSAESLRQLGGRAPRVDRDSWSGIFRPCITTCGTTTSRRNRCCSRFAGTAARSRRWRSRPRWDSSSF